jgi:hypothetical protein
MTEAAFIEAIYLTTGSLTFMGVLIGLMVLVSLLRQRRLDYFYAVALPVVVDLPAAPITATREIVEVPAAEVDTPQPEEESAEIDERWQLPVRDGTPDLVNIMIEPDGGLTRNEENIQRLIDYLKRETGTHRPV